MLTGMWPERICMRGTRMEVTEPAPLKTASAREASTYRRSILPRWRRSWFGGTGYLLTRYSTLQVGLGLVASVASGLVGGGIIFVFLTKVLMSDEENMDPADYEMVGVLGKVSSSIREGGTGEIVYSQMGTRRVCGARSEDNSAIAKGAEVVVTRYEKGIAYVRLWSDMSGDQ
jgi:hypothetical protein